MRKIILLFSFSLFTIHLVTAQPIINTGSATLTTEGCLPNNGVIDPGETVTVSFCATNTGSANTINLVGTMQVSGGVTPISAPQNYAVVTFGGPAVCRSFTFTNSGTCGGTITVSIQMQDGATNLGTVSWTFTLGTVITIFTENFDAVVTPVLPAGWVATNVIGPAPLWETSSSGVPAPAALSLPNSIFIKSPPFVSDKQIVTPTFTPGAGAKLSFAHVYYLEPFYDGGVLEISINGGAFQDIITAGGSFVTGGYDFVIDCCFSSPIAGRVMAWTSRNRGPGFMTTIVNIPPAAVGLPCVLKFRMGSDTSDGREGWRIDNVTITQPACCVPNCTITLSSAAGTDNQTVCKNLPVTNITYATTLATGASFTGLPAGVTGNWASNVVTISGTPTVSGVFNYTVTLIGCPSVTTATGTITVTEPPAATIVYSGSPYCSNAGTASVTRTGTAGGTYSVAPAGLTINSSTGTVTPNTSIPGTYTVTYTIAAGGGCPAVTATTNITITAAPNMIIFYAGTPYCSNAGTATVSRFGTASGTYSAAPAGLTINAATGAVTLGTSTPGTYTVTYSVTVAGCGTTITTTTITITAAPNATINYAGSPYCSNAGTANVTLTGTTGGTYSSTAGLTLNAATGTVTSGSSTPGTYTVTYTVSASGGCPAYTTTASITLTTFPAATIAYPGLPYCQNAGTATVTRTGTAGGIYTAAPAGLSINAVTGDVNLAASTAGTYTVTYTLAAGGGCPAVTATASITITALPAATITYAGGPYCQPGSIATVTRTGTAGGVYSATPAGLVITALNGDINIATSTPGTYTVTYTIAAGGGCGGVIATTFVTINSPSVAATAATATSSAVCGPGSVSLGVTGGALGSGATWRWYSGSCGGTLAGAGATLNLTVNATTTYFVRAEGICNTTTCASITVTVNTQPTISIAASPGTTLLPGITTTLTATVTPAAGNTITWYRNGDVVAGATGLTLVISVSDLGTYTARATTAVGCMALSNDVTITAEGSSEVFVYPNPGSGRFEVRIYNKRGKQLSVLVHNARGQLVYFDRKVTSTPYTRMDVYLKRAAAGYYIVSVIDSDGEIIGRKSIIIYH